jgi:poly(3-hydroxybutyrate) depolymerase
MAQSLKDPAADLCAVLTARTFAGVALVAGTNLFSAGRQEPGSRPAVYLLNAGGSSPVGFLGGNREAYYTPQVQVLVEGVEDSWSAAEGLARALYDELKYATVSGYVGVFCRDAQPAYLGENMWVINLDVPWA